MTTQTVEGPVVELGPEDPAQKAGYELLSVRAAGAGALPPPALATRGEKLEPFKARQLARYVDRTADRYVPELDVQVVYRQEPKRRGGGHYGSRLVFSGDGRLFITQGDRMIDAGRAQAQKLDSGIGKVVRINADGSIPTDNPFVGRQDARPEIWSIGHRNIQAAALHPETGEPAVYLGRRRQSWFAGLPLDESERLLNIVCG